ncbi:hypothetical protein ACFFX0_16320 [Citricoccus parietis]|uniref:Uncharacterized protein n=1 Tax=Citricoccus parietis TaxID=592307 RepID=A0ABV5G198_9MICC
MHRPGQPGHLGIRQQRVEHRGMLPPGRNQPHQLAGLCLFAGEVGYRNHGTIMPALTGFKA